jgi:predicted PurR-regulated permease PerM
MASAKNSADYPRPPSHWPFPPVGRNLFLITGLLLLALTLLPFWGSIAVAAVFAFGLTNPVSKLANKLGRHRRITAGLVVAALSILILFPAAFFSVRLYQVVASSKGSNQEVLVGLSPFTLNKASTAMAKVEEWAIQTVIGAKIFEDGGDAQQTIRESLTLLGKRALALVSAALMNLPVLFLEMMVFGLFLYVFLAYPIPIRRSAFRLNIFRPQDLKRAIRIMKESSYNSLVSNFLVGLLQASIITVGARFAGYNESVLIFSVVFAVSYIPFVGSAPLGYLLAVLSFVTGSTGEGFLMLGVATFAGIIDNIVRPFLVSNGGTEVHPVLSFASIIGSIGVFGLKGLFLGPVILTATIALLGHTSGAGRRGAQPKQRVTGVIHRLSSGQKKAAGAEADF